jgi:hypothetical protein
MFGLKAAHDVTVAPIRAFATNKPVATIDSIDEVDHHEHGLVKRGLKSVYRKTIKKLHPSGMSNDDNTCSINSQRYVESSIIHTRGSAAQNSANHYPTTSHCLKK